MTSAAAPASALPRSFGSLAVVVILLGVWPAPLLDVMHASVDNLLIQATQSKL